MSYELLIRDGQVVVNWYDHGQITQKQTQEEFLFLRVIHYQDKKNSLFKFSCMVQEFTNCFANYDATFSIGRLSGGRAIFH